MIDNRDAIQGHRLDKYETVIDTHLIRIPGVDGYYWDPEGDRVLSKRTHGCYHQMKRYPPNTFSDVKESHYSLARSGVYTNKIYLLSELRNLKPQTKKEENMKQEKYIVGSITKTSSGWSISQFPVVHASEEIANTEAARLARAEPAKKFVVLEVKGIVTVADVVWE